MDNTQDNCPNQEEPSMDRYFRQLRLARSAELARSKRFLEATEVLAPNRRWPVHPTELDMLARIAVRLRRFDEARRLWETASRNQPDTKKHQTCLEVLERFSRASLQKQKFLVYSLAGLLAISFVIVGIQLIRTKNSSPQVPAPTNGPVNPPGATEPHQTSPEEVNPAETNQGR